VDVILDAQSVRCGYGRFDVVHDISFTVSAGEVLCLLGPNGAGKTTLFKSLLGLLPLRGGRVLLAGRDLSTWRRRELARTVAYVPQAQAAPFPFTVAEVVLMGRTPRLGVAGSPGRADVLAAQENMSRLGVDHLAGRPFTGISGGERQLVLIARALTQEPELLMMDEPTSNLDLGNQARVLREIRALAADGLAIIMISQPRPRVRRGHHRSPAAPRNAAGGHARGRHHGREPGRCLRDRDRDPARHRHPRCRCDRVRSAPVTAGIATAGIASPR